MKKYGYRQRIGLFWDFIISGWQAMRGLYVLSKLPYPMVTIFGGTHAPLDENHAKQAAQLAALCARNNISVITGGGPGIMQAANCAAKGKTLGIGLYGVDDDFNNPCTQVIKVNHFYVRRWLLIQYSLGFVIFPGGIGTMNELFDLLNDRKHNKVLAMPIVLVDVAYWSPLIMWFKESALKQGYVDPDYLKLFVVTDDVQEAFNIMQKGWQELERKSNDKKIDINER